MSHVANTGDTGDPGWPELLPPDRDPRSAVPPEPEPEPVNDPDDDLFAGWEPRRRVDRLTVVLAACVLVVVGFVVGAVVAKRSASTNATTPTAARFAGAGGAGGAGARGGFGGFGGFPGGGGTGESRGGGGTGAAGAATGGAGPGGADTGGTPVVVGTVTSIGSNQITVTNFAGTKVVVRVPPGTPVTTPGLRGLTKGQTVSVEGTRASDGTVTATAVVSRS